jgi:hypothetical protein
LVPLGYFLPKGMFLELVPSKKIDHFVWCSASLQATIDEFLVQTSAPSFHHEMIRYWCWQNLVTVNVYVCDKIDR